MPFKSKAQQGYLHAHPEILGKEKLAEFDAASKGKKLPGHVPSYHEGISFVPKTGLAQLEKGEKVVPAKENKMASANPFEKITAGDKEAPKPPKHIREIVTRKTHDGKMIHTHKHWHPEHHPDEEHVSTSMADVHNHAEDHMGTPNMGEESPAGGGPAPLTAAAPAMPAPAAA